MIAACAYCGRDNETGSRYCMDCGKPLDPAAARAVPAYIPAASVPAPAGAAIPVRAPVAAPPDGAGYRQPIPPTRVSNDVRPPQPAARVSSSPHPPTPDPRPTVNCPRCARQVDGSLPFCGACGTRMSAPPAISQGACTGCGTAYQPGDLFCARCGNRVGTRVSVEASVEESGTLLFARRSLSTGPKLALLDERGEVATVFTLERGEAVIGRGDADIRFGDDSYMSPLHARVEMREGTLWLRDLGSRNLSWVFVDEPTRLADGDMILIGSQVLRFRRLGFPGPYSTDADATRRMGSLTPSADVAVLEQLRPDGSVRDVLHLSPGRSIVAGRESGDWLFPYDQTMSGRHAEIRSEDSEFFVHDVGSRNGVAVAVRGEKTLKSGQRVLLGDQILRVESM